MSIFVRSFSVDISCPGTRYVGQTGTVYGSVRAEIENDGDSAELVSYEIEVEDSEGNRGRNASYAYVLAGDAENVDAGASATGSYEEVGHHTGTARAKVHTESESTSCTWHVYSRDRMPRELKEALEKQPESKE